MPVVSSASGREQILLTRVVTECFTEIEASMNCQARFLVEGLDCRRDLSDKKEHGPRYVRGRIRWETNGTKLMEQRQEVTANWSSVKLWRRPCLRERWRQPGFPGCGCRGDFGRLEDADGRRRKRDYG